MPQVSDGPKELNDLLESVYSECMKKIKNETKCSKIAWGAASNAGWHKDKDGNWKKKSDAEIREDELIKKAGIRRNRRGAGRMGGNRAGAGPGGKCICPSCKTEVDHQVGMPCYSVKCPKCGAQMTRK